MTLKPRFNNLHAVLKLLRLLNGTAALHIALLLAGVKRDDIVITQALTFVATCNALSYIGAEPLFIDVSLKTLGLCPKALDAYLQVNAFVDDQGVCKHKATNKRISAIVPRIHLAILWKLMKFNNRLNQVEYSHQLKMLPKV